MTSISDKLVNKLLLTGILVVAFLSVLAFCDTLFFKSLLLDEALFARNVYRYPEGLYFQSAPSAPLFYVLTYGLTQLLGQNEWVFRFFPAITAIIGMILWIRWNWRIFEKPVSFVMSILVIIAFPLNHYAANAHAYATDFFVTMLLFVLLDSYFQNPSVKKLWMWILAACVTLFFSMPAFFIVGGLFGVVVIDLFIREKQKAILRILLYSLPLLISMAVLFFLFYIKIASERGDLSYWGHFFPESILPWVFLPWLVQNTMQLLGYFFWNNHLGWIGFMLILLGLIQLIHARDFRRVLMLVLPVGITISAAVLQKWPYGATRTMLFILPLYAILIGYGLQFIWDKIHRQWTQIVSFGCMLFLLLPNAWVLKGAFLWETDGVEAIRTLSEKMETSIEDLDRFLVYYAADTHFQFYMRPYLDRAVVAPWSHKGQPDSLRNFVQSQFKQTQGRVWLFLSHIEPEEDKIMMRVADSIAVRIKEFKAPGCQAVLYKLDEKSKLK